jgi:hypothetical protein
MKIAADCAISLAGETITGFGIMEKRNIASRATGEASAFLIKSVTLVRPDLIRDSRLKFIANPAIGIKHEELIV